jgi:hypothetical protein
VRWPSTTGHLASWDRRSVRRRRALMPNSGRCVLEFLCADWTLSVAKAIVNSDLSYNGEHG